MSNCWFTVDVEPDVHLALFRLAGTFAAEDVERLIAERDRAFGSLTSAQNRHVALVDIRKMTPQGLSGFAAFGQLLLRQEPRALRLAFLIVTNLASMQAQLAAHGRGAQFFFDEAQARTWLLAHTAPPLASLLSHPRKLGKRDKRRLSPHSLQDRSRSQAHSSRKALVELLRDARLWPITARIARSSFVRPSVSPDFTIGRATLPRVPEIENGAPQPSRTPRASTTARAEAEGCARSVPCPTQTRDSSAKLD